MESPKLQPFIYLIVLALFWGSSFILMKIGLVVYNSYEVALLRLTIAGWAMIPFIRWNKIDIKRGDWKFFAISGFVGSAIPAFLFTKAQTVIASSLAGALNGLTPLFALIIGLMIFGATVNRFKVIGVLLGILGAFTLILGDKGQIEATGSGYVVLATVLYGLNVNVIKHKLNDYPPLLVAALPLFMVSIVTTTVLLVLGIDIGFEQQQVVSLSAVIVLAVVGTGISLVLFNKLIQRTNVVYASSVTYLIPIVALFWGIIDHELVRVNHLLGLGLILLAIWLVRKEK